MHPATGAVPTYLDGFGPTEAAGNPVAGVHPGLFSESSFTLFSSCLRAFVPSAYARRAPADKS